MGFEVDGASSRRSFDRSFEPARVELTRPDEPQADIAPQDGATALEPRGPGAPWDRAPDGPGIGRTPARGEGLPGSRPTLLGSPDAAAPQQPPQPGPGQTVPVFTGPIGVHQPARVAAPPAADPQPDAEVHVRETVKAMAIQKEPCVVPMTTPEERALDESIRQKIAGDPRKQAAYDQLKRTKLFQEPDVLPPWADQNHANRPGEKAQARIAILQQINTNDHPEVIGNLAKMADRKWYGAQSYEDQQRSAKVIAYNSDPRNRGHGEVRRNTVAQVVNNDKPPLVWTSDLPAGTGARVRSSPPFGAPGAIEMNRATVAAGPNPINPDRSRENVAATNHLAHEVNHVLNYNHRDTWFWDWREGTATQLAEEYMGYSAGHLSENGRNMTRGEAADTLAFVATEYPDLARTLDGKNEAKKAELVHYVERQLDLPAGTLRPEDLRNAEALRQKIREKLGDSATETAAKLPEPGRRGDRNHPLNVA